MARPPKLTDKDIEAASNAADEAADLCRTIEGGISKQNLGHITDPDEFAKSLMVAARTILNAAISLMNQHDIQEMRKASVETSRHITIARGELPQERSE